MLLDWASRPHVQLQVPLDEEAEGGLTLKAGSWREGPSAKGYEEGALGAGKGNAEPPD